MHHVPVQSLTMSERLESSNGNLALPLLALLSIAATFFTPQEEGLATTRPKASAGGDDGPGNSRLWHDPFERRDKLPLGAPAIAPAPANVLLITVPAGSRSVDTESRCRTRVALHAAMNSLGYEPVDAATLYCLQTNLAHAGGGRGALDARPVDATATAEPATPAVRTRAAQPAGIRLPFEEFRCSDPRSPRSTAVAFWIPERELQDRLGSRWAKELQHILVASMLDRQVAMSPLLVALHGLGLRWLTPAAAAQADEAGELVRSIRYTLIGPATTDSLRRTDLAGLRVRSPWVTGVDVQAEAPEADIRSLICTDHALAKTLADELSKRSIGPESSVLLVLERDSAFARSWQEHLETAMLPSPAAQTRADTGYDATTTAANRRRFFHAWYSRGIDGEAADTSQTDGKRLAVEPPAGSNTIDYLRRLRNEFRRGHEASRVDAVGIFGQDIHDKLLIVRALRSTFPEAVFFTNDLDAFYGHPSQLPHTRNLLVASGHGLLPDAQLDAAADLQTPFRNAYQTSTWLAIRAALLPDPARDNPAGDATDTNATMGSVFEIGSAGPVRLEPGSGATTADLLGNGLALLAVLLLAALLHWRMTGGKLTNASARFTRARRGWHWAALAVTALCLSTWLAVWCSDEPASWVDGLSIWPSETIRLLALALTMVFAYHVCRALHRVSQWVPADATAAQATVNAPSLFASVVAGANALFLALWRCTDPLRAIVRRWRRVPQPESAGVRALPPNDRSPREIVRRKAWSALGMALLLLAIGQIVMRIFGMPRTPARGSLATTLDLVIVMTSVVAMLWLVFLVVEVTRQYVTMCRTATLRLPQEPEAGAMATGNPETFDRARAFLTNLAQAGSRGIYGPFIVIMLLCLARWHGFDNWTWPLGLQIVIGISGACVLFAHISLHRAAVALRNRVIRRLSQAIEIDQGANKRLGMIRDDVRALTHGIFAGPTNHPVMRALVIPFTGLGGLSLLQWVQML